MHNHFIAAVHQIFLDIGSGGHEDQTVIFQCHGTQRLHPGMKRKIAEILFQIQTDLLPKQGKIFQK